MVIYSKDGNYIDENENNIKIEPLSIRLFEDELYNLSELNETINYEKIRKNFFQKNYGLKIGNNLKKDIFGTIGAVNKYKNEFYFLFLFSFPFNDFAKYHNLEEELIFILKYNKIPYFSLMEAFAR